MVWASVRQEPPASGINAFTDSIRVKRAYGQVLTPIGLLMVGRMGMPQWGLAGHREIVSDRPTGCGRNDRREYGGTRRRSVLGDSARRHVDVEQPRELAGKLDHPAFLPVAAVTVDDRRQRRHQTGPSGSPAFSTWAWRSPKARTTSSFWLSQWPSILWPIPFGRR